MKVPELPDKNVFPTPLTGDLLKIPKRSNFLQLSVKSIKSMTNCLNESLLTLSVCFRRPQHQIVVPLTVALVFKIEEYSLYIGMIKKAFTSESSCVILSMIYRFPC